jgi:hypothetical protein
VLPEASELCATAATICSVRWSDTARESKRFQRHAEPTKKRLPYARILKKISMLKHVIKTHSVM